MQKEMKADLSITQVVNPKNPDILFYSFFNVWAAVREKERAPLNLRFLNCFLFISFKEKKTKLIHKPNIREDDQHQNVKGRDCRVEPFEKNGQ